MTSDTKDDAVRASWKRLPSTFTAKALTRMQNLGAKTDVLAQHSS